MRSKSQSWIEYKEMQRHRKSFKDIADQWQWKKVYLLIVRDNDDDTFDEKEEKREWKKDDDDGKKVQKKMMMTMKMRGENEMRKDEDGKFWLKQKADKLTKSFRKVSHRQ